MPTSQLFLDTTIQIDRLFKGRYADRVENIKRTIEESDETLTSTYVLKEFRSRVCRDLVYYYNVLCEKCLMSYLHSRNERLPREQQRRKQMFEAFQVSFWIEAESIGKDGNLSDQVDREIAEKLKFWLRSAIEDWWDWFHESVDRISNETECIHAKSGARRVGDTYDCSIRRCDSGVCQIITFFRNRRTKIERIVEYLKSLPPDELTNELKQIREVFDDLLPGLDGNLVFSDCRKCGDAIIILEAPANYVFYTTNRAEAEHLKVPLDLEVEHP